MLRGLTDTMRRTCKILVGELMIPMGVALDVESEETC